MVRMLKSKLAKLSVVVENRSPSYFRLRWTALSSRHNGVTTLLREEERAAHSMARCLTAHHRDVRAGPRTNRTL